ncbi:hypothetical protein CKAH01_11881 [Colletotrichum kahawae]|uniref:Uncharacterized protein n=1 Tax=Colletotrichum kahawae TaxID=34407 RepID=A0AAE0DFS7_COLKA|nr:hypothetical protein CKAH01_11881 [Colletotrichum kahawae]
MEAALKQANGPLRNHYIVSVNYAAWCFIGIKMAETTSAEIHEHLKSSKRFYEQNIIYGLQHMSVADLPTTALFQALLSGIPSLRIIMPIFRTRGLRHQNVHLMVTQELVDSTWDNEPFGDLISLLSLLIGLASGMFAAQSGPSQQTKSRVPSIAENLGTAPPESVVVDGPMTEELFSHPIEWNEEGVSLADSLALMVDWDVPEIGRESHSIA